MESITSDMFEGYTKIVECAFYKFDSLTSITIPNSVKSIGLNAFNRCNKLKIVKLEKI